MHIKEASKGECIIMGDFNHGHMSRDTPADTSNTQMDISI